MKLVFAGAPEFSVLPLKKILEEGYEVAAVVTQPDKPVGRKAIVCLLYTSVDFGEPRSGASCFLPLPILSPLFLKQL